MSVSTSCSERGERLLRDMLRGARLDLDAVRSLIRDDCSDALFRIVVEGLADRFEPKLNEFYVELFAEALVEVSPQFRAADLIERYRRVRTPRLCRRDAKQVYVLSRVTLGADIAVTSVLLQAAKQRFPKARIVFVGSAKCVEMWAGDRRIEHVPAPYPRGGGIRERVEASLALEDLFGSQESIVLDPDSRLTQLGMVPVCAEENYFFFESRSCGGESDLALPELASRWCEEVFQVRGAESYLDLHTPHDNPNAATAHVSLGVGENLSKRVGGNFEAGLLRALAELGCSIMVDRGAGGEERERVDRAIAQSGVRASTWDGSFAEFAGSMRTGGLYVGYDSAGQHAAAALGVPLVAVFAGQVSNRMFERWKPTGKGPIAIVNAENREPEQVLQSTVDAIREIRKF